MCFGSYHYHPQPPSIHPIRPQPPQLREQAESAIANAAFALLVDPGIYDAYGKLAHAIALAVWSIASRSVTIGNSICLGGCMRAVVTGGAGFLGSHLCD